MIKKILTAIISLAIIITGIIGFSRLRYWERSVWIFKMNNEQTFRGGRFERGGPPNRNFRPQEGDLRAGDRPDLRNLPDSVRQRMIEERGLRTETDSLRQGRTGAVPGDRKEFNGRRPERDGRQGRDFRGGNSIRLRNVLWFLAVFSLAALLTIYIDKLLKSVRKRKKKLI